MKTVKLLKQKVETEESNEPGPQNPKTSITPDLNQLMTKKAQKLPDQLPRLNIDAIFTGSETGQGGTRKHQTSSS